MLNYFQQNKKKSSFVCLTIVIANKYLNETFHKLKKMQLLFTNNIAYFFKFTALTKVLRKIF